MEPVTLIEAGAALLDLKSHDGQHALSAQVMRRTRKGLRCGDDLTTRLFLPPARHGRHRRVS
jgi:hypothetical protein